MLQVGEALLKTCLLLLKQNQLHLTCLLLLKQNQLHLTSPERVQGLVYPQDPLVLPSSIPQLSIPQHLLPHLACFRG